MSDDDGGMAVVALMALELAAVVLACVVLYAAVRGGL